MQDTFQFQGKRVSVIGAQRSGLDAARILRALGATVLLSDSKTHEALSGAGPESIAALDVAFVGRATPDEALPEGTALVVTSPGVPKTAPVLREAVRRGIPVWGEIELAYRLCRVPILAITGTNGKTTTTLLAAAMLRASGVHAIAAGNVSADEVKRTLVDAAWATADPANTPDNTVIVAEISSFQLEWVEQFAPRVGVLTNITPDHLNRHADFAEYAQTKARLFAAQGPNDFAIFNGRDPMAQEIGQQVTARADGPSVLWSAQSQIGVVIGAFWSGFLEIRFRSGEPLVVPIFRNEMAPTLPGQHSEENALCAALAAALLGATPEGIAHALRTFPGVPHRMEWVGDVDDVRFINNSMCTNVMAGVRSLRALDRPAVVIAGGADKALDFAPLAPALRQSARHLVLIGSASEKIENTLRQEGYEAITRTDTLEAAVAEARRHARPGDAVLLSPTCASFDMFADFEARGAAFRRIVRDLHGEETPS